MEMVKQLILGTMLMAVISCQPEPQDKSNKIAEADEPTESYIGDSNRVKLKSNKAHVVKAQDSAVFYIEPNTFATDKKKYTLVYENNLLCCRKIVDLIFDPNNTDKYANIGSIEVYALNAKGNKIPIENDFKITLPELPFATTIYVLSDTIIDNSKILELAIEADPNNEHYPMCERTLIMDKNENNNIYLKKFYHLWYKIDLMHKNITIVRFFDDYCIGERFIVFPKYNHVFPAGVLSEMMRNVTGTMPERRSCTSKDTLGVDCSPIGAQAIPFFCYKTNRGNYYVYTDTFTVRPNMMIYPVYEKRDHQWVMDYLDKLIESVEE